MEFSDIAIPPYISHCYISKSIVETTSNSDHVDERYRVVTSKNRPNPSHVYAEFVVRRESSVDSSGGGQGTTTSSAGLEDDAASTLSELTELSDSRAPRDGEDSDEESEEEIGEELIEVGFSSSPVHSLKLAAKGVFASYRSPTYFTGVVGPIHTFQTLDGVDVYSQKVRGTKDAMYNVFESVGTETVTPPFLPKYLVMPFDLHIHWWSGGVRA
ncbi:hypothetical protein EDB92DRAFT_1952945 [Lactarius akahatsu]|uniref:Uncharacterized protein n=1 Tax=Lactarius akahatsu TaxID=416441 RepID=A0AAD4LB95_9AGAM|nr:hypothetical protein EDB92DRAFT_1952945 [Lactarius akahatsu]